MSSQGRAWLASQNTTVKPHFQIALAYLVFGILWILFSDWIVSNLTGEPKEIVLLQIFKGSLFVLLSSLLIFFLAKRAAEKLKKTEAAKRVAQKQILADAYHILLNYLNQMQLVTLEAENNQRVRPETLALARQLSEEAASELKKLEHTSLGAASSSFNAEASLGKKG